VTFVGAIEIPAFPGDVKTRFGRKFEVCVCTCGGTEGVLCVKVDVGTSVASVRLLDERRGGVNFSLFLVSCSVWDGSGVAGVMSGVGGISITPR